MTPLDQLGRDRVGDIAALCARALPDPPSVEELDKALFSADQPALVRGDPRVGIVASVEGDGHGYIRLLAVDPSVQGRGHGRTLLEAAECDLSDTPSVTVGADAPYFLFPGVETTQTSMLSLLERRHFHRVDTNFNMGVDLTALPADPGGARLATPPDAEAVSSWMEEHWANWRVEALRALHQSSLLLTEDDEGITGFCAYDVNRAGLLGPIAVRPGLIGSSAGRPLLLGALHRMRSAGRSYAEVVWVGPIVPYSRVGAVVSRVFFVYRKEVRR